MILNKIDSKLSRIKYSCRSQRKVKSESHMSAVELGEWKAEACLIIADQTHPPGEIKLLTGREGHEELY